MLFQISGNTVYVIKQNKKLKDRTKKEIFGSDNNFKRKKYILWKSNLINFIDILKYTSTSV